MIPKEWLEGKTWEPFVIPVIVVLVGLSAFALGRLSAQTQAAPLAEGATLGQ